MAHNLHYLVVKADNHTDAQNEAQNHLYDFGNENNWFEICGSVDKNGNIEVTGEGRWGEDCLKLDTIYENICSNIGSIKPEDRERFSRVILDPDCNISDLWQLKKFVEDLYCISRAPCVETFDIWTNSFRDYEFDEFGITNLEYTQGNSYIVAIDMHS